MDCDRALEIYSASLDGETPEGLDDALDHCASCPSCAPEARSMRRLAAMSTIAAPDGFAERVMDRIAVETARGAASPIEWESDLATHAPPAPSRRPLWWVPRVGAFAAAAAVVVLAVVAVRGDVTLRGGRPAPGSPVAESAAKSDAAAPALSAAPAPAATLAQASPEFAEFGGLVYASLGETSTNIHLHPPRPGDVVTSALDTPGAPFVSRARRVEGGLVLFVPDGRALAFRLVTRARAGRAFALRGDGRITRFGIWPGWPPGMASPIDAHGVTRLHAAGADDAGVAVFVPAGKDVSAGFAVAPGAPAGDPIAGDPHWTWWEPQP